MNAFTAPIVTKAHKKTSRKEAVGVLSDSRKFSEQTNRAHHAVNFTVAPLLVGQNDLLLMFVMSQKVSEFQPKTAIKQQK